MLNATMMAVIVVELVSTQNNALNANVLEEKLAMIFLIQCLEMDIAKMKPTMLSAAMMVVTAVGMLTCLQMAIVMMELTLTLAFMMVVTAV